MLSKQILQSFRRGFGFVFQNIAPRSAVAESAPDASPLEGARLTPAKFFTQERCDALSASFAKMNNSRVERVTPLPSKNPEESAIQVEFMRDGQNYSAKFFVAREATGASYHLRCEMQGADGIVFFKNSQAGYNYLQLEAAMTYRFESAFAPGEN